MILQVDNIHLSFGGIKALNGVSLNVNDDELVSLIGPNGAGKTSIINCICKFYRVDEGKVFFKGEDITNLAPHEVATRKIARTFQNLDLFKGMTVLDNVKLGAHIHRKAGILSNIFYYGKTCFEEKQLEQYVESEILYFLGLEKHKNQLVGSLAYGLQKKVDFARALAAKPELLILDEPAAGMNDQETVEITEDIKKLRKSKGISVLLIEHDMNLVMNISDRIYCINFGQNIAEGKPEEVKLNRDVIDIYLGEKYNKERGCQ